jgi:hypothetical protein
VSTTVIRQWCTRGAIQPLVDQTVVLVGDAEVDEMMLPGQTSFVVVDILVEELVGDERDDAVTHYGWRDRGDAPDSLPCGIFPRFYPDAPRGAAEEFRAEVIRALLEASSRSSSAVAIARMRAIDAPWMALDVTFISGSLIASPAGPLLIPIMSGSDRAQEQGVGRRIALRVSVVRERERAMA